MDTTFKTYTPPVTQEPVIETPKDNTGVSGKYEDEPIELREEHGGDIVLEALDIDEDIKSMPHADRENLAEVKHYILDIINNKGISPTMGAFKLTLNDIKAEMGLDERAEPSVVLDRIGSVIKAWKNLSFVSDPHEKRRVFMKLARSNSSSEINRIVFEEMERRKVWQ